jgi:hypothetical protein
MHDLGLTLIHAREHFGDSVHLIVWKSDVTQAYRLMPVTPLWQIWQIITINGNRHVNRCNHFGNRAGGQIWASFYSLVLWIAVIIKKIYDLLGYIDNNFSWDFANST